MKRLLVLIVAILLSTTSCALASSCPLPTVNTDADIQFSGFEWYTDYRTTVDTALKKGIDGKFDWVRDKFDNDSFLTPHWEALYNIVNSYAGSEKRCGRYLNYIYDIPDVAGYKVDSLALYMMYNLESGYTENFSAPGAVQFYMAKYEFDVADSKSCYEDLVVKLKKLYGDNPYVGESSSYDPDPYTCWVNEKGAMVGVCDSGYTVYLLYMAPGAEERLLEIEEKVRQQEIEEAKDDMSGL